MAESLHQVLRGGPCRRSLSRCLGDSLCNLVARWPLAMPVSFPRPGPVRAACAQTHELLGRTHNLAVLEQRDAATEHRAKLAETFRALYAAAPGAVVARVLRETHRYILDIDPQQTAIPDSAGAEKARLAAHGSSRAVSGKRPASQLEVSFHGGAIASPLAQAVRTRGAAAEAPPAPVPKLSVDEWVERHRTRPSEDAGTAAMRAMAVLASALAQQQQVAGEAGAEQWLRQREAERVFVEHLWGAALSLRV